MSVLDVREQCVLEWQMQFAMQSPVKGEGMWHNDRLPPAAWTEACLLHAVNSTLKISRWGLLSRLSITSNSTLH